MAQTDPPKSTGALNTLRHSLSEPQWQAALEVTKSQKVEDPPDKDQRDPEQTRHRAVRRCLLRVPRDQAPPGIYLVRSSDISAGGIRIIHGGPVKPQTVCAVIIESTEGRSTAAGGVVAWCNPVKDTDPPAYEIGIDFYESIDTAPFVQRDDESEEAA